MTLDQVEEVVSQTLLQLPKDFQQQLENVAVIVKDWPDNSERQALHLPSSSFLLGLYTGVPKTQRAGTLSLLPDKITVFAGPILAVSQNEDDAKERIKSTVLHEIGHYFGMSEEQLQRR